MLQSYSPSYSDWYQELLPVSMYMCMYVWNALAILIMNTPFSVYAIINYSTVCVYIICRVSIIIIIIVYSASLPSSFFKSLSEELT